MSCKGGKATSAEEPRRAEGNEGQVRTVTSPAGINLRPRMKRMPMTIDRRAETPARKGGGEGGGGGRGQLAFEARARVAEAS